MPLDWERIVLDLALHLRSARLLDEVRLILDGAERDLAQLEYPFDFWERVGRAYEANARGCFDNARAGGLRIDACVRVMILDKIHS